MDIFKKKKDDNDLIWGIDAARILGISKRTFDDRGLHGYYKGEGKDRAKFQTSPLA